MVTVKHANKLIINEAYLRTLGGANFSQTIQSTVDRDISDLITSGGEIAFVRPNVQSLRSLYGDLIPYVAARVIDKEVTLKVDEWDYHNRLSRVVGKANLYETLLMVIK